MERDGDLGNYLKFNFENAIEIIDKFTKDNHALLDWIEELEAKFNKPITISMPNKMIYIISNFIECVHAEQDESHVRDWAIRDQAREIALAVRHVAAINDA